jgi:hypothetical protein
MATLKQINERKKLKQDLFKIRRFTEGKNVEMTPELYDLKKKYENTPGFTSWSDFPDRWDIGDPFKVKEKAWGNEVDRKNFARAFGKSYEEIIHKFVSNEVTVYLNGE